VVKLPDGVKPEELTQDVLEEIAEQIAWEEDSHCYGNGIEVQESEPTDEAAVISLIRDLDGEVILAA